MLLKTTVILITRHSRATGEEQVISNKRAKVVFDYFDKK